MSQPGGDQLVEKERQLCSHWMTCATCIGESAKTNYLPIAQVPVDQPPCAVGVRFPLCPPDSEKTEETGEDGDPDHVGGGSAGPSSSVRSVVFPVISLEDRFLVALSRRGSLRIGQFISSALDRCRATWDDEMRLPNGVVHDCAQGVPDREYVEACERYADLLGRTP